MCPYFWEWEESRPLPADGIKAQTQRGAFGKTWWSGRWIAALERLVDSARLSRGRSYARRGQVVKLEAGVNGVAALVQGSRPSAYEVSIRFRLLSDQEWERVIEAMAAEAIFSAKLLSGEMPAEIEKVFSLAGASLFPAGVRDLETKCSCPDWANPCKHVAAVHYLLGEQFEADPFLIFQMRGRTKEQIVTALRAKRAGALPEESAAQPEDAGHEEEFVPLAASLDSFWSAPAEILDMEMDFSPPPVDALPVKRLGPASFWTSRQDFVTTMEKLYREIGDRARRLATGDG